MRVKILKFVRSCINFVRWNSTKYSNIISLKDDHKLSLMSNSIKRPSDKEGIPVLFIPSYYQMKFSRMHDITMVFALILRGARVTPVLTSDIFQDQDVIYGGIYNRYRKQKKKWYSKIEKKIWVDLLKTKPIYLKNFIKTSDYKIARTLINKITIKNYREFQFKGYDVGKKAAIATSNLNNMAVLEDRVYILEEFKSHATNIIILLLAYERLFKKLQPEILFSEFPHYYQWDVPYFIASRLKIFFASSVITEKKNSWFFSTNTNSFQDATPAWNSFRTSSDCKNEFEFINKAIKERTSRSVSYSPVFPRKRSESLLTEIQDFASSKPTLFLPVNVLFDLAVFKESPLFSNILEMIDWIIKYFQVRPEYNLIIKAHPAEKLFYESHLKSADVYCLSNWIKRQGYSFPKNIKFLDYDSAISAFDIMPLIKLGLVYTSTTAVEMAWAGTPVISTSFNHYNNKDFVISPETTTKLEKEIQRLLEGTEDESVIKKRIINSKKYYLLYYYHTFINLGLIQGSDTGKVKDTILYDNIEALIPGKNIALDYMCDTILSKKPAFGPNRWPPFTEPK